ncbi:retinol dehydrogenase 11-like [Penaeus japonicus]|uniref:retinol dehydrogenase 11-like n=1 Tax=Penaeus japonicus TaxID=27405 RepID=UPI001C715F90|nr:retinol dehydrogenase 11-like [Penaeus japonicus]XP_042864245.1 retinol dehydrogenase 11-like [Penaeus japonicus]XP_042864246.1 retinol dehydrogenase 11-like [Penaeus japonicus]XP_042864247.1 retinol dehydrogenase 11-like [Penaeus japonicus]
MWWIALSLLVLIVVIRIWYRLQSGHCTSQKTLDGKTVIITGASAGIGKSTAFDMARRKARVILACRNLEKAQKVADEIIRDTGNNSVIVRKLDTSDLSSVRSFASEIIKTEDSLHILINNAGMAGHHKRESTTDGLELTMATNHYGHFLLTNLLLNLLKKSAPSRVINVSSKMHEYCRKLDPEDLNFEKSSYSIFESYNRSKLCNILFTLELAERLHGTGVTTNSLHPGAVDTEIAYKMGGFAGYAQAFLFKLMAKDCELGAQTTIHLAVSDSVEGISGKYFVDCKETESSKLAQHRGIAKKLWLASELDVKLENEEVK